MNSVPSPIEPISQQSNWHGTAAGRNESRYTFLKITQIILAAAIPIVALAGATTYERWVIALMGGLIGVLEGVLQLGNWLLCRATREALKREPFLHGAAAGPYGGVDNADTIYIERCDSIISGETAKWVSSQEQSRPVRKQ